ncbi:hypothetical protein [Peptoniphilus phoceensis]|uniref:hypothetical protein n=2 Tax=Peptoniphilus phoceensis TaxID=1720298 RepID=UPI000AC3E312|nr:hypothetical protein [Peptoniphilus phoceensis]
MNYMLGNKLEICNTKVIDFDDLILSESLESNELYYKKINFDFLMSNKDIDVLIEILLQF